MKKYISILLGLLFFQSIFFGCKKEDDYITTEPYITFNISPTTIKAGSEAILTVWSNVSVDEDIIINISSSDKSIATSTEILTLKKGTKTNSGVINAITVGETTVSIGFDNSNYLKEDGEINIIIEAKETK